MSANLVTQRQGLGKAQGGPRGCMSQGRVPANHSHSLAPPGGDPSRQALLSIGVHMPSTDMPPALASLLAETLRAKGIPKEQVSHSRYSDQLVKKKVLNCRSLEIIWSNLLF